LLSKWDTLREGEWKRRKTGYLAEKLVDILVMIGQAFDENIELVDELSDVRATLRIGLGEGHR
jgi:hypothetical protein